LARRRKRLVLYSGGQERRNALIHQDLLALGPSRKDVRMTYVPFCSEGSDVFYRRFVRRYRAYGGTHFDCLPVDQPGLRRDPATARRILDSDIVYLAGGNTFYFLEHLRRAGLLDVLRRFARQGGVLAGLSAGALLLTPHIALAGYPKWACAGSARSRW
jgi:dipeptidase E